MITEDYVSFETAKLLKEKGFDEFTFSYYSNDGLVGFMEVETRVSDGYQRPTLQMAMKWLREEKNCFIDIHNSNGDGYFYEFVDLRDRGHLFSNNCCRLLPTYEEACEAAIKYCLENLISNETDIR